MQQAAALPQIMPYQVQTKYTPNAQESQQQTRIVKPLMVVLTIIVNLEHLNPDQHLHQIP